MAILSSFPPPSLAPPPLSVHRKGEKEENRLLLFLLFFRAKIANPPSPPLGERKRGSANCFVNTDEKEGKEGKEGRACRFAQKGKIHPFFFWGGMERFSSSRNKMPPSYLLHKTLTVGAEEEKKQKGGDRMRVVGYFPPPHFIPLLFEGRKKELEKGGKRGKRGWKWGPICLLLLSPPIFHFPLPSLPPESRSRSWLSDEICYYILKTAY